MSNYLERKFDERFYNHLYKITLNYTNLKK